MSTIFFNQRGVAHNRERAEGYAIIQNRLCVQYNGSPYAVYANTDPTMCVLAYLTLIFWDNFFDETLFLTDKSIMKFLSKATDNGTDFTMLRGESDDRYLSNFDFTRLYKKYVHHIDTVDVRTATECGRPVKDIEDMNEVVRRAVKAFEIFFASKFDNSLDLIENFYRVFVSEEHTLHITREQIKQAMEEKLFYSNEEGGLHSEKIWVADEP